MSGRGRMSARFGRILRALGPAMPVPRLREVLRSSLGAGGALGLCGILLLILGRWLEIPSGAVLIAPLGATTFLLFAVPNSPLAQPWSAMIGNAAAATVAILALGLGLGTEATAAIAVCGAMVAMALLRAMHPPGAAIALATVLAGEAGAVPGFDFVLAPVLLDTAVIVVLAVAYNRLTGRVYPFRQPAAPTGEAAAREGRLGLDAADLAAVLDRFRLGANIGAEDFGRVLAAAEAEAARRYFDDISCAQVMSRNLVVVRPRTRLGNVAELFRRNSFKTVPVVDGEGRMLGLITQNDLIQRARMNAVGAGSGFAQSMSTLLGMAGRAEPRAEDIMSRDPQTVRPEDGIGPLVQLLADGGVQAAPVLTEGRLVGIVTRSDLLSVLARRSLLSALSGRAA